MSLFVGKRVCCKGFRVVAVLTMVLIGAVLVPWQPISRIVDRKDILNLGISIKRNKVNISKHINYSEGNASNSSSTEWYFIPREQRLNDFNFTFLERSNQTCKENEQPFLIIVCLTEYDHVTTRHVIRNTWGSVVRTGKWPRSNTTYQQLKLFFISGKNANTETSTEIDKNVKEEIVTYGDIVLVDFEDTYRNLSTKVLMALRWVQTFCSGAKFVLKVDEDSFIHLPNLIKHLKTVPNFNEGHIHGHVLTSPIVNRWGKWMVQKDVYPYYRYPLYASGCAYVISRNIVSDLLYAAEHMPFIPNEDAFITGILRTSVGAVLHHARGFTFRAERAPLPCSFQNDVRKAGTNTNDNLKNELWRSLGNSTLRNCYKPFGLYIPNFPLDKWLTERHLYG